MTSSKTGKSVGGESNSLPGGLAGGIINEVLSNPETQKKVLSAVFGFLLGLFKKKKQAPTGPVTSPTPAPNQTDDDFPDDNIPAPPGTNERVVAKVVAKLIRLQYNKALFPDEYKDGKDGLYDNPRSFEGGQNAINTASKGWVDATAYDQFGKEFLRDAVIANRLQYQTEHHVGDAYIKGNGGEPEAPAPYETRDTNSVGNGISAWISSMGFLHQVKFHTEGEHEVYVVVGGVKSNTFRVKVS